MTSRTEDFITGLKTYLAASITGLTADKITVGLPDDRLVDDAEVAVLQVAISALDLRPDPDNGTSGRKYIVVRNPDNTATLTYPPLPFRLFVQLNTFTRTHIEDWQLQQDLIRFFASGKEIVTPAAETYYPHYEGGDNQDDLTDQGFAKAYRFSVPLWLTDAHAAESEYLVLHTIFDINDETVTVPEEE